MRESARSKSQQSNATVKDGAVAEKASLIRGFFVWVLGFENREIMIIFTTWKNGSEYLITVFTNVQILV